MASRALDAAATESALRRQLQWARRGTSALHLLLDRQPLVAWRHYPRRDLIDHAAGWQLYGHAHPDHHPLPDGMAPEAAHLHLFQREPSGALSHLIGLALDSRGQPLRWFTTNLWVTGGNWLDADAAHAALTQLAWQRGGRLAGVLAWLRALISAYRQPLHELLQQRDAALERLRAHTAATLEAAQQDRNVSILSCLPVDWPDELIDGQAQPSWTYHPTIG